MAFLLLDSDKKDEILKNITILPVLITGKSRTALITSIHDNRTSAIKITSHYNSLNGGHIVHFNNTVRSHDDDESIDEENRTVIISMFYGRYVRHASDKNSFRKSWIQRIGLPEAPLTKPIRGLIGSRRRFIYITDRSNIKPDIWQDQSKIRLFKTKILKGPNKVIKFSTIRSDLVYFLDKGEPSPG